MKLWYLQGTAAVVLAGLIAALKSAGGTLVDHTFLFFGAGEVSCVLMHLSLLLKYCNFVSPSNEIPGENLIMERKKKNER